MEDDEVTDNSENSEVNSVMELYLKIKSTVSMRMVKQ